VGRAKPGAIRAIQVRFGVSPVNDQIPNVWNPSKSIRKNKDGILLVEKGIAQQQQRAGQAQPPKSRWHNDSFHFFSGIPLNDESAEEHTVSQPSDDLPNVPLDAQKLALRQNQIV
jgi:hypothetical protein